MRVKIIVRCMLALTLMLGISLWGLAQENSPVKLPPGGQGSALLAEHCTKCHNLDEVVRLRQTREQWEGTVYSMIARGAPVFSDEAVLIVDYLSVAFGPDTPK